MWFIENKYSRYYFSIINKALKESRVKGCGVYYENHHIQPKSLGGVDDKINRVLLTAKEHAVCHLLLVKMTVGLSRSKMWTVLSRMKGKSKNHVERYTSRTYEKLRLAWANSFIASEKQRRASSRRMSEWNKTRTGSDNPFFGKRHTEEVMKVIAEKNRKSKHSEEWKRNKSEEVRARGFGKTKTPEQWEKIWDAFRKRAEANPIRSNDWIVEKDGSPFNVRNLKKFCRDNNLKYLTFYRGTIVDGYRLVGKANG
jgi:hypothetical protein